MRTCDCQVCIQKETIEKLEKDHNAVVKALREIHDLFGRPGKHETLEELKSCIIDSMASAKIDYEQDLNELRKDTDELYQEVVALRAEKARLSRSALHKFLDFIGGHEQ